MTRTATLITVAITALSFAGCGSTTTSPDTHPNTGQVQNLRPPDRYTEADVIRALQLTDEDPDYPGLSWKTPSGVSIAVIMTDRETVEMYAGAGDQVATNPAGDVGVKFSGEWDTHGDLRSGGDAAAAAELAEGLEELR